MKLNHHNWKGEVNYVRAWLMIECTYFFSWIGCACFFMVIAYIGKFKSTVKSEAVLEMDDNVWNDRKTDDFLRYMKFEFFVMTYFLSFAL